MTDLNMQSIAERFAAAVQIHQTGDARRAEQIYRQILQEDASHLGAQTNLGVSLAQQNRSEEAIAAYQAALRIDPKYADAQFNLGNAYRRMNRYAEAVGCYQAVLRLAPNHTSSMHNLGLAYGLLGRWPEAIAAQQKAIQTDPNFAEAYNHLADGLMKVGKIDEAIQTFQGFIRLRPTDPRGFHNLSLAFAQKGNYDAAIAGLEQALRLKPDYAEGHNSLGVILEGVGRSQEAFEHYQQAVKLKPRFPDALNNLGTACTEIGLHDEAYRYRRLSLQIVPGAPHIHSNLLLTLHYSAKTPRMQLLEEAKEWAKMHADKHAPSFPPSPRNPDPDRKLKIGYVSSDFRIHTVAAFIEPLLRYRDAEHFEVNCFANLSRGDAKTEQMQKLADGWHNIFHMSDDAVAELIRDQEIDILVDLNGHTAHNRLLVFARKPAAIQATVFGYPDTTGMGAMDYRLSDPHADPEGSEKYYVEKLWRLPEVAWCCDPPTETPEVGPLPADKNGYVTFGSLNNLAKVTPEMIAVWSEILTQVPKSKLILLTGKGGFGGDRLRGLFAQHGIGMDRVQLMGRLTKPEYLGMHNSIDLYFDPYPYNGGVTSCDCLWMGTPLVTLAGDSYFTRQGHALLTNLGLPEFIAKSSEEYRDIALRMANDLNTLRELKSSLRDRVRQSPAMDGKRYVANLEKGYREMWRKALAS